jgi:hypothetical protein
MAIATLALCYNNHGVFTGVVKIRRGLSAKVRLEARSLREHFLTLLALQMVDQATNMDAIYYYFALFLNVVEAKLPADDPSRDRTIKAIAAARVCGSRPEHCHCLLKLTPLVLST